MRAATWALSLRLIIATVVPGTLGVVSIGRVEHWQSQWHTNDQWSVEHWQSQWHTNDQWHVGHWQSQWHTSHRHMKSQWHTEKLCATGFASALLKQSLLSVSADGAPLNVPPAGFTALFNGTDLNGWQGLVGNPPARAAMSPEELKVAQAQADVAMREHWRVSDGILMFDGHGDNLCTIKEYENFELYIDWRIEPHGDSGIYLRGSPQVQIWDTFQGDQSRSGSGGLFNNLNHADQPLVRADRPLGQWNTFYVMMMGDQVSVKLNDKLVVDKQVFENYWQRDRPIYVRGPIELQAHGTPLYFRNVFVRELPHDPSPPWELLFDGTNLDRWDFQRRGWRIDDDALTASRRRANRNGDNSIWTKDRFGDFILDLEFKMSPECDSGIFIRTDDPKDWLHTGIEIQILDSFGRVTVDKHDCGAVYDVCAPRANPARPAEQWNHVTIVAQDNLLSVVLNDQQVIDIDLNDWSRAHENPDGTSNRFDTAVRDLKREGFIGFQDNGSPVWFRNVRIKRLD
jgi:hypothetical protein